MTFINLINEILRRLRETEVSTSTENDYAKLIGDLINDAKSVVESSHEWTALRETLTFDTVAATKTYALTGAFQNATFKEAINDTSNTFLRTVNRNYINQETYIGSAAQGTPQYYAWNGTDGTGQLQVDLHPTPDAIYSMRFDMVIPQPALTTDSTFLKVPFNPVLQLAYGYALREKGETGGQSAAEQFGVASIALSDAIQIDANKYQDELTFVAC
jgi:hypothetical protein